MGMSKRIRLRGEHQQWLVDIGERDVVVEGVPAPFAIEALEGGGGRSTVTGGNGSLSGSAATDGDTVWVELEQEVFEFRIVHGRGGATALDHDALSAPMSATVTRVAVKVGDRVETGDVLVALEAMKMELPIRAPHDGVVTAVNCQEGDLVQPGVELVGVRGHSVEDSRGISTREPGSFPQSDP